MGYETMIIGWREDDPRRFMMQGGTVLAGRCGACRHNTYLNPSGVEAMRTRDCAVFCHNCSEERMANGGKVYDQLIGDMTPPR